MRRSHGLVGALLAGVVLSGVLQAVPAQAAPTDSTLAATKVEQMADDPVPVPGGPVTPPAGPTGPAGGQLVLTPEQQAKYDDVEAEDAALARAKATGKKVEITSRTTESSISYAQPDGTVKVEVAAGPVRTKVDGVWVPVDTTLQFTADGVQPKAVTGDITFSDGDAGTAMAELGDGEATSVALGWAGDLPRPTLRGDTATYAEVLPHVDLH
ncbi:hypothetical protein [Modestobacter sp. NPDC049651]|uniref:hypothetical protein n=1 Tax=unclassified Modestobacter TaxID=2643866 RepID=UPI0033F6CE5D